MSLYALDEAHVQKRTAFRDVARIVWAICIFEWAMMLQNGLDSMVAIGPGVEVASAMAHG